MSVNIKIGSRCNLGKEIELIAVNYVSALGNKYPVVDYTNHGFGDIKAGLKDLPDEYPYKIEYSKRQAWKMCIGCTTCNNVINPDLHKKILSLTYNSKIWKLS
jgi:hypothetical protein